MLWSELEKKVGDEVKTGKEMVLKEDEVGMGEKVVIDEENRSSGETRR